MNAYRSMLQRTLERLNRVNPPSRTLTVIGTDHEDLAMPQVAGLSDHVWAQPGSRDTGIALYVALAMIKRWTPNAAVTLTPADHYVAPGAAYVAQIAAAQAQCLRMREHVLLFGAKPSAADPELGYVLVGDRVAGAEATRHVCGFVEKPVLPIASDLVARGALWNTMVTCGTVDALWELGCSTRPAFMTALAALLPVIGTAKEDAALSGFYRVQEPISFSRDMLERAPDLVARELEGVEWSDWGRADCIEKVLRQRRAA